MAGGGVPGMLITYDLTRRTPWAREGGCGPEERPINCA